MDLASCDGSRRRETPRQSLSFPRPLDAGAYVGLLQASLAARNPVLRRPPVLEDYVSVTSTGGSRAFLVLRADPVGTGVQVGAVWPQGEVGGSVLSRRVLDLISPLGPWGPLRKFTGLDSLSPSPSYLFFVSFFFFLRVLPIPVSFFLGILG